MKTQSEETTAIYKGPTAPLTSICFSTDGKTVFSGCWDKSIWSWDIESCIPKRKYEGHTDFVKTVRCVAIDDTEILLSGGADAEFIAWRVSDGRRICGYKEHARGIQDMAIDPILTTDDSANLTIFTAGSDRSIRRFHVSSAPKNETSSDPILQHETSVYKLFFDADGDLWTASADKTARCLTRQSNWSTEVKLEHPDFVKDVIVSESGGWVVTACRDEEIRVWNRAVRLPPFTMFVQI